MRVLLVTPRFPPDVGGLEAYVGWLAGVLRDTADVDVHVVTTTRGRRRVEDVWDGVPVTRLATWFMLSNTPLNPLWWGQVRRLVRELRPDVVNVHAPVPGLPDLATFAAGSVPVVMTYHAGSLVKGRGGVVDAVLRFYERWILPRVFDRCSELIAVSPVSMAYRTGRAVLAPPGVDTSLFHPAAEEPSRTPTLLYAGRLEMTSRWKGVQVLVDALPEVADAVPDVVLDVAGDGDAVPWLRERAAARGVADRVRWHGTMTPVELAGLYARASITVLPSLTEAESFGMTLVEAMACGCPVVGSRVGGIPFVIREGVDGLLTAPGDPHALGQTLVELLTDPGRRSAIGRAGRRAAEEKWAWGRQRERTLEVLRRSATARFTAP